MLKIQKVIEIVFRLFCYSFALTSNNIFSFPVKSFFFLLLAVLIFLNTKWNFFLKKKIFKIILIFFSFFIWFVMGLSNEMGNEYSFQQLLKIIVAVGIAILMFVIFQNKLIQKEKIKLILYSTMWISICFKFILELIYVFDLGDLNFICNEIFGMPVMLTKIGDMGLTRINLVIDVVPFIMSGFYIIDAKNKIYLKIILIVFLVIYTLICFSRLDFMHFSIIMIFLTYVHCQKIKCSFFTWKSIFYIFILIVFIFLFFGINEELYRALENRFIGSDAQFSDGARIIQSVYLFSAIAEAPLMGHGMGYYLENLIRHDAQPFIYELEYLSLTMQFGMIGILLILILYISFLKMINYSMISFEVKGIMILNLIVLFIKPFFNPMLFSSNYIFCIFSLMILGECVTNRNLNNN